LKPAIKVFNKIDLVPPEFVERKVRRYKGVGVSAINPRTLEPLVMAMQDQVAGFLHRAIPPLIKNER